MKKKNYLYLGIVVIIVFIIFSLLRIKSLNHVVNFNTSKLSKKEKILYEDYVIKDLRGYTYTLKIEKELMKKCFLLNTGYKLLSDNIIEKKLKVPSKVFNCFKKNINFNKIDLIKRKDIIIDNNGILHIINSNIRLDIIGYKLYGQK